MIRRLLLVFIAVLTLAIPARAELLFVTDTGDGYLNMRRGPGTGFAIVTRLTAGTELDATAASGPWRQVGLPDGTVGWAHGRYLTPLYHEQRPYDLVVNHTADGYLNLRAGPGTRHAILRRLHAGQRLMARGSSGGWIEIALPEGTRGWVFGRYVTPLH